jgi:hypothetical protein
MIPENTIFATEIVLAHILLIVNGFEETVPRDKSDTRSEMHTSLSCP